MNSRCLYPHPSHDILSLPLKHAELLQFHGVRLSPSSIPRISNSCSSLSLQAMASESANPWGPNEPSSVVLAEESWLQGALISCIAYGALFVLFIQCTSLLWKQTTRSNYRTKVPFLVIVFLIFFFGTLFNGAMMKYTQLAFVENRNYPGGPNSYENDMFYIPVNTMGDVAFSLSSWLCDGLLVRTLRLLVDY